MEQIRKLMLLTAYLYVSCVCVHADDALPNDIGTIEALIDAHKQMKKAEDLAVLQLGAIADEQIVTEKTTTAFSKTRTVLNKRMSDVNSYLSLAAQLLNVTNKVARTVDSYANFTEYSYKYALKNPLVMYCYTNANLQISKEIGHMQKLIAGYTASGLNLLKATMQEKYRVLSQIDYVVFRINQIISKANMVCRSMIDNGIKRWHVEDMIKNDLSKTISENLINLWNQK